MAFLVALADNPRGRIVDALRQVSKATRSRSLTALHQRWRQTFGDLAYMEAQIRQSPSYRAAFKAHMLKPAVVDALAKLVAKDDDYGRMIQAARLLRDIAEEEIGERRFLPPVREVPQKEAGLPSLGPPHHLAPPPPSPVGPVDLGVLAAGAVVGEDTEANKAEVEAEAAAPFDWDAHLGRTQAGNQVLESLRGGTGGGGEAP